MTSLPVASAPSRGRTIAYWVTTVIIVFVLGSGGVADLLRPPQVVAAHVLLSIRSGRRRMATPAGPKANSANTLHVVQDVVLRTSAFYH